MLINLALMCRMVNSGVLFCKICVIKISYGKKNNIIQFWNIEKHLKAIKNQQLFTTTFKKLSYHKEEKTNFFLLKM